MVSYGLDWAVAKTAPRSEDLASRSLEGIGLECYVPKFKENRSVVPLFRGYAFFQIADGWRQAFQVRHVTGVIMSGERPAPIRPSVISEIKNREGSDGLIEMEELRPQRVRWRKGQPVRTKHGVFFGLSGVFAKHFGGSRVKVLFDILGQQVVVVMRGEDLDPVT